MQYIRIYKCIITGSDGKQSQFLVKGGEDLRNDERIELLFDLMNRVVSTSTSSTTLNEDNLTRSTNNLRARTYSVIPMTSKMGIMEWVSNTQTLKAVISGEMALDENFCKENPDFCSSGDITRIEGATLREKWIKGEFIYLYISVKCIQTCVFMYIHCSCVNIDIYINIHIKFRNTYSLGS